MKTGPVRLEVDQPPRPGDRRVLGCRLIEAQPEKAAQRQRVGSPPGDPTLRIDALEVPDQEQPEIGPRQQTGTADRRGVERGALRLDERVETRACPGPDLAADRTDARP